MLLYIPYLVITTPFLVFIQINTKKCMQVIINTVYLIFFSLVFYIYTSFRFQLKIGKLPNNLLKLS